MPPTAVVMIGMPRRRYSRVENPDAFDSREQTTEVKASDDLDESLELATLVDVSKRPQGRMGGDVLGIGPENDDLDIVPHAFEDRGSIEEPARPFAPSRSR